MAANGAHWGANACQTVLESVSAAMSVCSGRSRGAKTAKTRRCLGHVGLSAPKFKRHPWVPNLGSWGQWVPGARFWCSESHLKIWSLFGVDFDPDPKWALGGLLGSRGGGEIFAEKNQSRSFLGPKLPKNSISGVGFGIKARLHGAKLDIWPFFSPRPRDSSL